MLNITVSITRSFYSKKKTAFLSEKPLLKFDWKVWEVKLWKMDPSTGQKGPQIAESRVTLLSNLPLPPCRRSTRTPEMPSGNTHQNCRDGTLQTDNLLAGFTDLNI